MFAANKFDTVWFRASIRVLCDPKIRLSIKTLIGIYLSACRPNNSTVLVFTEHSGNPHCLWYKDGGKTSRG